MQFLRPPARAQMMKGGQGCFQRSWFNHVWKASYLSCSGYVALRHTVLPLPTFARLLGWVRDSCFLSNKVAKSCKTWRLLGARPKTEETDCYHQKMCRHLQCRNTMKAKGTSPTPTRLCFARICCLDPCYISWLKLGFPTGWRACAWCLFPCGNIAVHWQDARGPTCKDNLSWMEAVAAVNSVRLTRR